MNRTISSRKVILVSILKLKKRMDKLHREAALAAFRLGDEANTTLD